MSNHESTPGNNRSSAPEQIPHSGVHGYERPVDEFDNTTLEEARDQGHLTIPRSPQEWTEKTDPKKKGNKLTRRQKIGIGVAAFMGVSVVGTGLGLAYWNNTLNNNGPTPDTTPDTGNSAPQTPGVEAPAAAEGVYVNPETAGFYGEVPAGFETPIILSDADAATLRETADLIEQGVESSEVYGRAKEIYDENLVPVMNEAVTALLANGGSAEGLNFSNVINDKNTILQLEELVSPYVQYGENQILQLCDTQPNEDGSRNFCGPLQASGISLNGNIVWDIFESNDTNLTGEEVSLKTAMQPRLYENKLIVATDGAIRSDF